MNKKHGCGALIINDNDEILLLLRPHNHHIDPGCWIQPGGKIEPGENPESAAIREVKEEMGVTIKIIRFLETPNFVDCTDTYWISHNYLAKIINGTPKNMEPDKHIDMKWFSLQNLPKNINEYTRNAIDAYLASKKLIVKSI